MKILVFAPHSQIWKHAFPEAVLVESLMKSNHEIIYVRCSGFMEKHCIPMISSHISFDASNKVKNQICKECKANSSLIVEKFNFPNIDLGNFLDKDAELTVNNIIKSTTQSNFQKIKVDDIKVGELALYQVLLRYKQSKVNSFSDQAWQEYLSQLEISLKTFFSLKKIFKIYKPDKVIQYSGLYSVNAVCRQLAEKNNISPYFLHAGINQRDRLQHLIIAKGHTFDFIKSLFISWQEKYRDLTCRRDSIKLVANNFIDIINSKSFLSYSKSKSNNHFDIYRKFNISKEKKVIVAILSSYYEHLAADAVGAYHHHIKPIFKTQIEWVKTLIDFISKRNDLFLIIRVHPREFSTKREKQSAIISQHATDLKAEFNKIPNNAVINWPTDQVSFYDLLEQTNLFLNAFSTSAREITMLGLPVLTYHNEDVLEPVSINYKGKSIEKYLEQIDILLEKRFDAKRIISAFRWRALEQVYSHVSIAESVKEKDDLLNIYEKILKKLKRYINKTFPLFSQKNDCNSRSINLKAKTQIDNLLKMNESNIANVINFSNDQIINKNQEINLIKVEIKRIMTYLYTNQVKSPIKGSLRAYLSEYLKDKS